MPFNGQIRAMKEPSLFERHADKTIEQYRFLWLRTFHKPIAVRIQKDNSGFTLRGVRLSGEGGYEPGHIEHDETIILSQDQWNGFLKLLDKSSFWLLPTEEKDAGGFDGAQWVLEGQRAGKYHIVDRWSPHSRADKRQLNDFVVCCRYLLKMSKQEVPKKDDY